VKMALANGLTFPQAEAGTMGAIKDAAFTATLGIIDGWIVTHEHQISDFLVEVPQECASYSSVSFSSEVFLCAFSNRLYC